MEKEEKLIFENIIRRGIAEIWMDASGAVWKEADAYKSTDVANKWLKKNGFREII